MRSGPFRLRAGHRLRVHGPGRSTRQRSRDADADGLLGSVPRQRFLPQRQLRDRPLRPVRLQRR